MKLVPSQLVEGLSDRDAQVAETWWCVLTYNDQAELCTLYDPHQDSCRVRSTQITILVNGELLCDDEEDTDDWADFYEYMLDHPEVFPPSVPIDRTFVIGCLNSKHGVHWVVEEASVGFLCPFNSPVCPFRR
jgi:hypothetical protein